MKIVVVGANGRTGRLVVSRASDTDVITAMMRRGAPSEGPPRVVIGDPLVLADVERAMEAQDAVICALGVHPEPPYDICRRATEVLLEAMSRTGVRRIAAITGAMVGHPHAHAGFVYRFAERFMPAAGRESIEDHRAQERLLVESGFDYTIVRPPRLTDEPARGEYRVGEEIDIGSLAHLGREDLADFLLRCVREPALVRRAVTIAY